MMTEHELIWSMIEKVPTAMMVSYTPTGLFHARPMQALQDKKDDTIYFFADHTSPKVKELMINHNVLLSFSCVDKDIYLAVYGTAHISEDMELIDRLWNPMTSAWFPEGKDSGKACLIEVKMESAEYWDASKNAMVKAFDVIRSNIAAKPPDMGEHGRIDL